MNRQVKIITMEIGQFSHCMRGQASVVNLPTDAEIVAATHIGTRLGFRVHSRSYPGLNQGESIPVVNAVVRVKQNAP